MSNTRTVRSNRIFNFQKLSRDGEMASLLAHLAMQPPSNFKKTSIEQVLRCDRAAWVRLAELVPTLKRDAGGELPLDKAFPGLVQDAQVLFHLLPLSGKGGGKNLVRRSPA